MRPGDVLVALGSSGLHSNGYSLVRHVLLERGGLALDSTPAELGGRTLADELLEPTRIYALDCLALAAEAGAHAFAHITGGGLAGNLVRVLPDGVSATVDRSTWAPQPVFDLSPAPGRSRWPIWNAPSTSASGMVAVVPADRVADALALATPRGPVRVGARPGRKRFHPGVHGGTAGREIFR